jgi:hypothetical protein
MLLQFVLWTTAITLVCGFAIKFGDQVMRMAGIWLLANIMFHTVASLVWDASPTIHLIDDGIYATGLLPLAFFSVSPWIGGLALLACGSFILQSVYLLTDQSTDRLFVTINNGITLAILLLLMIGSTADLLRRRRERAVANVALAAA